MIYPIVKYGQPVLEENAEAIAEFDTPELHKLVDDMFESMYAARGVGLAAPQIGVGQEDGGDRYFDGRGSGAKDRADQSGDRVEGRHTDQRRRLPEHSHVSRAGDAGARKSRCARATRRAASSK